MSVEDDILQGLDPDQLRHATKVLMQETLYGLLDSLMERREEVVARCVPRDGYPTIDSMGTDEQGWMAILLLIDIKRLVRGDDIHEFVKLPRPTS